MRENIYPALKNFTDEEIIRGEETGIYLDSCEMEEYSLNTTGDSAEFWFYPYDVHTLITVVAHKHHANFEYLIVHYSVHGFGRAFKCSFSSAFCQEVTSFSFQEIVSSLKLLLQRHQGIPNKGDE